MPTLEKPFALVLPIFAIAVAACGGGASTPPSAVPDAHMTSPEIAATESRATALAGGWQGTATFEQTIGGDTRTSVVAVTLAVGQDGWPEQLAALGLVGAWHNYAPSPAAGSNGVATSLRGSAASMYVYCEDESDGPANAVELTPTYAASEAASFAWRYDAKYRIADLVSYSGYDYTKPTAAKVTVRAVETYTRATNGDLQVRASADGADDAGRPVRLRFDATLKPRAAGSMECNCALRAPTRCGG